MYWGLIIVLNIFYLAIIYAILKGIPAEKDIIDRYENEKESERFNNRKEKEYIKDICLNFLVEKELLEYSGYSGYSNMYNISSKILNPTSTVKDKRKE